MVIARFITADNPAMSRFVKETWLATAVFGGLGAWFATVDRDKGVIHYAAIITALIVAPLFWKSFVVRQGRPRVLRAALAGAASALLILWSGPISDVVRSLPRSSKNASEGLAGLFVLFFLFMTVCSVPLGAGIGSLVAFVQAHVLSGPPQEPRVADVRWDGAVGGALVATLVAPFAAIPIAGLMQVFPRAPGLNYLTITVAAWLVLVSAGVWLGVKAIRRWERIQAVADGAIVRAARRQAPRQWD